LVNFLWGKIKSDEFLALWHSQNIPKNGTKITISDKKKVPREHFRKIFKKNFEKMHFFCWNLT
jgi:hypothetical protein